MTSVVCINQLSGGTISMSIKQEPETDGDAADQPEPLNLSKPKFQKLDNDELTGTVQGSDTIFTSETGSYKEELHDIKQTLKDLIQSRRLAEGKNLLTPVDLISEPVKLEMSQEEVVRAEERKEQNRKAAHRCRMRRKQQMHVLKEEEAKLKKRRKELEHQITQLNQEKQTLLLTIRSDKCALSNNNDKCKGGNSSSNSYCDLSDTDSQEMPLNLHKDISEINEQCDKSSVVSESSKKFTNDYTRPCKYCCCQCRCHHKNITDSEGSLSDASFELDLSIDENDKEASSDNKLMNKNIPSVSDSVTKSWRKRLMRSHSWESSTLELKSSENNSSKDDLDTAETKTGLQEFYSRTREEKAQKVTPVSNFPGQLESRITSKEENTVLDDNPYTASMKKLNKFAADTTKQALKFKLTNVSDSDSQYCTDSNESSPNIKIYNKYDVTFDSLNIKKNRELECINNNFSKKKPFFYSDTMN